jgi:hypothetical protein
VFSWDHKTAPKEKCNKRATEKRYLAKRPKCSNQQKSTQTQKRNPKTKIINKENKTHVLPLAMARGIVNDGEGASLPLPRSEVVVVVTKDDLDGPTTFLPTGP